MSHEAAELFCQLDRRPFHPIHGDLTTSPYDTCRKEAVADAHA